MTRRVLIAVLVLGLTCPAWSTIVTPTIENPDFEMPGFDTTSWENVPGWNSDTPAINSGVKSESSSTEGPWTGYLYNGDPSVFNLTNYIVEHDNEFIMQINARNASTENPSAILNINLFIDVYGERVTITSKTVDVTDIWTTFSIEYYADTLPAVYNKIGIELANVTPGNDSFIDFDNVRFVPEPSTITLLCLGSLVLLKSRKYK